MWGEGKPRLREALEEDWGRSGRSSTPGTRSRKALSRLRVLSESRWPGGARGREGVLTAIGFKSCQVRLLSHSPTWRPPAFSIDSVVKTHSFLYRSFRLGFEAIVFKQSGPAVLKAGVEGLGS